MEDELKSLDSPLYKKVCEILHHLSYQEDNCLSLKAELQTLNKLQEEVSKVLTLRLQPSMPSFSYPEGTCLS